jgi:ABC-2 type transport system ATP-binding protein
MLQIKNLSFRYGKHRVFQDFGLDVPDGQVCLITGVNGVGKSTLLKLFAGVLRPDAGTIEFPKSMAQDPKRKIGFISDSLSLYKSLTVGQAIRYHRDVYSVRTFDDNLIRHTKIERGQRVKDLSAGQRTIFHLSLILSTEPDILLIDEVIHSIDAYLRKLFLDQLIALISRRSVTVIMVNLNFYDIEHIVNRVILLRSGKILVDEPIEELKAKVKKIVAAKQPAALAVLSQSDFSGYSEFYVYPYEPGLAGDIEGNVVDLNLTEIISAFIGGEYAEQGIS